MTEQKGRNGSGKYPRRSNNLEPDARVQAQEVFLGVFRLTGNVSLGAKKAGVSRQMVYYWKEHYTTFLEEFNDALKDAGEALEAEAYRRAVQGVKREKPHFDKEGKRVYTEVITTYSDTLLIYLLNGALPDKYVHRSRHEITGKDGESLPLYLIDAVLAEGDEDVKS